MHHEQSTTNFSFVPITDDVTLGSRLYDDMLKKPLVHAPDTFDAKHLFYSCSKIFVLSQDKPVILSSTSFQLGVFGASRVDRASKFLPCQDTLDRLRISQTVGLFLLDHDTPWDINFVQTTYGVLVIQSAQMPRDLT